MSDATRHDELLALLAWWREAGVDVAMDDVPVDWSARRDSGPGDAFVWPSGPAAEQAIADQRPVAAAPPRTAPPPTIHTPPAARTPAAPVRASPSARIPEEPTPSPSAPALRYDLSTPVAPPNRSARDAAGRARTLADLEAALRNFDGCALKATAKNLCFFRGNPHGRLMVIGEAPGREEDLEGRPFVGPAGQLLDRMLAAIDLTEADVHITNVVYWRPPGNRPPTLDEVEACRPFLARHIELVAPRFVMTLGSPAAKAILGATDGILRVRGKWGEITAGALTVPVMPTLHPAYLLRTPAAKRQAWRDLLAVKVALENGAEGEPQ